MKRRDFLKGLLAAPFVASAAAEAFTRPDTNTLKIANEFVRGSNLLFYGDTHATRANDIVFRHNNDEILLYDGTTDEWILTDEATSRRISQLWV